MAQKIILSSDEPIVCPQCQHRFEIGQGITRQTIERYEQDFTSAMEERSVELRRDIEKETAKKLERTYTTQLESLKDELTEEWNTLESRLNRLDLFRKICRGFLRFLRWSGIFMGIVWLLDLFVFPLIIYYLNAFLSGFDVSTIPNVWPYQKNFLLYGSLTGVFVALIITIKSFLKK